MGYDNATIQTDNGPRLVGHVRNNQRVIRDEAARHYISAGQNSAVINVYA